MKYARAGVMFVVYIYFLDSSVVHVRSWRTRIMYINSVGGVLSEYICIIRIVGIHRYLLIAIVRLSVNNWVVVTHFQYIYLTIYDCVLRI